MVNEKWEQFIEKQQHPKISGVEPVSETDYYLFQRLVHGFIDSLSLSLLSFCGLTSNAIKAIKSPLNLKMYSSDEYYNR